MWYFDRVDAKRPEPRTTLRKVALAGALSTIPCAIVGWMFLENLAPAGDTYESIFFQAFISAAAVEELAKVLVVYWFVWHKPEFDERLDGIVYAARAGLGFALVENVLYLHATQSMNEFAVIYLLRAFLAVPGHALWASVMGYCAAMRRFDGTGPGLVGGYFLALLLHGSYDAVIFLHEPLSENGPQNLILLAVLLVAATMIGGLAIVLRRMARRALARDDAHHAYLASLATLASRYQASW